MNTTEVRQSITHLKDMAKVLVLLLPKLEHKGDIGPIHAQSIDILMGLTELEGKLFQLPEQNMTACIQDTSINLYDEDQEVKKLKSRLPKWGKNPAQINSKILGQFLRLRKKGPVKVEAFRNAYGNHSEFDKNFPQMKMISERNHGKVFEVIDGFVEIWPKAQMFVEEFANQVGI